MDFETEIEIRDDEQNEEKYIALRDSKPSVERRDNKVYQLMERIEYLDKWIDRINGLALDVDEEYFAEQNKPYQKQLGEAGSSLYSVYSAARRERNSAIRTYHKEIELFNQWLAERYGVMYPYNQGYRERE